MPADLQSRLDPVEFGALKELGALQTFQQRYRMRKSELILAEDYIEHEFEDNSESVSFKVPYNQIDVQFPTRLVDKNVIQSSLNALID